MFLLSLLAPRQLIVSTCRPVILLYNIPCIIARYYIGCQCPLFRPVVRVSLASPVVVVWIRRLFGPRHATAGQVAVLCSK